MELVDKESEQWYCAKDELMFYAKENRTVENVRLDLKESAPEQVVGKLEPEAPTTSEPASSSKKTKFCRECGAGIPRDSKYCEECGASLV
jgi:membrane protease subunit (stomatin/prohibitin family)